MDWHAFLRDWSHASASRGFESEAFGEVGGFPLLASSKGDPSQPCIYLSTGIHGDEPSGPQALFGLLNENFFDENCVPAEDYDLWLRASKNNDLNIFLMNEPLYYYREIGSINPIKMLLAYSYERQMYKKYVSDFKFLVFKSYLKSIIVKFLCVINQFQFLINRRSNQVIDTTVLKRTNLEIQTIENTNVNGLI